MDRFAVVIVNYNTRGDLRNCLRTVVAAEPHEVVVADNGSADGSREMVREAFPSVTLLCLDENPGYGGAANRAIAATSAPYVFLLNSDTLIAPDALDALGVYLGEHPGVAFAGPRLVNHDGSLQPSCYPFPGSLRWVLDNDDVGRLLGRVPLLRELSLRTWRHDRSRRVPWVKGAALAIRRSAFDAVGGFDESFFMYHEESDLCYRLTEAGWEVHFAPVTEVIHMGGTSTTQWQSEMDAALCKSTAYFHRKHYADTHLWLVEHAWKGLAWARQYTAKTPSRLRPMAQARTGDLRGDRTAIPKVRPRPPMELMLPNGWARSPHVLGSSIPRWSEGYGTGEHPDHTADFVLVVPNAAECRMAGWLADALREVEAVARRGGMGYVLVPPWWRKDVERYLRGAEGIRFERFAHLPNAASPRFVVPVAEAPLRYALAHAAGLPPWARRIAIRLVAVRIIRCLLAWWWSSIGLVVHNDRAEPFAWLTHFAPTSEKPPHIITRMSWRGSDAPVVLHCHSAPEGAQVLVVKVARGAASSASCRREAKNLEALSDRAMLAGARLPTVVASLQVGSAPVLIETPVKGTPAALLVASRPDRVPEIMERVAEWLVRWHEATRTDRPISEEHITQWIGEPLRQLRSELTEADGYEESIQKVAELVRGITAPLVAAHHDLTMSNVLLDGTIGVVDWEEAEPHALPLGDFFYASTDLVLAARGGTRVDAFRACFSRTGRYADRVRAHTEAFVDVLGLSPALVRLSFDACWLRHACNEVNRPLPRQDRPFVDILRWRAHHGDQLYVLEEP